MSSVSRFRRVHLLASACLLVLWIAAGCSESPVEARGYVVPAGGMLTYKGTPVPEARLTFHLGDDTSEPAFAVTDSEGKFKCVTNDSSEGVRPGEYVVTVTSPLGGLPEKYASPRTSPLQVTIEDADANDLRLELDD